MKVAFIGDSHGQALGPRLKKLLGNVSVTANPGWSEARYAGVTVPDADLVIYQLGGNNFHTGAKYRADVEALIKAARGQPVLWIGPGFATEPATAKRHEATANLQAALMPELGVAWMDSRPFTRTGHRSDGVHFEGAAYDRWARAIAERVRGAPILGQRRDSAASSPARWIAVAALAVVGLIAARRLA